LVDFLSVRNRKKSQWQENLVAGSAALLPLRARRFVRLSRAPSDFFGAPLDGVRGAPAPPREPLLDLLKFGIAKLPQHAHRPRQSRGTERTGRDETAWGVQRFEQDSGGQR
jgi:hypothetical protein